MKILGLSGKKQAGKNTIANFILGMELKANGFIRDHFIIQKDGRLWVSDMFGGDTDFEGYLDINRRNETMKAFVDNQIGPYIKFYSFADCLKELCIDILGIGEAQCYGTDEQKNSETNLKWEDMLGVITNEDKLSKDLESNFTYHKPGNMTGREVLQFVGTNIFRKMKDNIWVEATLNKISKDQSKYAIITDLRFPNEVDGIQNVGGKVIRLTRAPFIEDNHSSECALDKENFNWDKFDFIVDNENMDITQQCDYIYDILEPIGYLPQRLDPSSKDKKE